jgi:hypothetical protein
MKRTWLRIRRGVQGIAVVALALGVSAGVVAAGERHAGSVRAVDAVGRGLTLDEFGVGGARRSVEFRFASDAEFVISEREEPVTNFSQTFRDSPIGLADIRPGDFVVVDVGGQPGVAERVVVTQRRTGS